MANPRAPLIALRGEVGRGARRRRAGLLSGGPLGQGMGDSRRVGPPYYLINDTFTTDRAAGAVHGTAAEPGPGVRSVVDSANLISISGGAANFAVGRPATGDPGIYYGRIANAAGRAMVASYLVEVQAGEVGWEEYPPSVAIDNSILIRTALSVRVEGTVIIVGDATLNTWYELAVIARAPGYLYFIKGGAFTHWALLWVSGAGSTAVPGTTVTSSNSIARLGRIAVPAALWLPAPLISDGFSTLVASDGLGHAEGVAGGLGAGGGGVTWTNDYGTWVVGGSGGVSKVKASALASGRAIRTADCGKADVLITAKCTLASGTMSIIVRWVDESNFIQLRLTSTNRQLVKVVGGVATTVSDTVYTYVAGAELRLICEGTKFRTYYNGAAVGAEFTISDAALRSATVVGLRTDNTGNTFDDLVVYARGSGGEYNTALDAI